MGFITDERSFLEGPRARWKEFLYTMAVVVQFVKGFRALHFVGPCVTVFGSARFDENHSYYKLTRSLAAEISKLGFTILTGGGPGLMEAANRGARDAGGLSIGCNIVLPHEQKENAYLDRFVLIDYFFVRKELLRKYSNAIVVMPGGFGTLDEFFETITLIQTSKIESFPIIIMGTAYHKDLMEHISQMAAAKTIHQDDLNLIFVTDSVEETLAYIKKNINAKQKARLQTKLKPNWLLGESN